MARDPEKVKAARRRWYAKNSEQAKQKVIDRRKKISAQLIEYRNESGCAHCGEKHPACLDFHHTDPLLDGDPNTRVFSLVWRNGWSFERILEELKACLILCANCHRKEHYLEK